MEENKKELNPEEMQAVSGGVSNGEPALMVYCCEDCGFISERLGPMIDHVEEAHHRTLRRSERKLTFRPRI